jgi:hypothetical protein
LSRLEDGKRFGLSPAACEDGKSEAKVWVGAWPGDPKWVGANQGDQNERL